jgi:hypothetical protein
LFKYGEAKRSDVVDSYQYALHILESSKDSAQSAPKIPYASYCLAAFLARTGKESGESSTQEIKGILTPIYTIKSRQLDAFLQASREISNTTKAAHDDIVRLARMDSRFADFLLGRGWQKVDFE